MNVKVAFMCLIPACSSPSTTTPTTGCQLDFSGNVTDTAHVAACVTLQSSDAGDSLLAIDTKSTAIARMTATINLGAAPVAAHLSSDVITDWSMVALSSTSSCTFDSGGSSVPQGSFTLSLSSVDKEHATAHGMLTFVALVQAPPMTDCGPGDVENIAIWF